ncbi:MAG: TonB-dependent receptor [Pseudomonadota bacterium]
MTHLRRTTAAAFLLAIAPSAARAEVDVPPQPLAAALVELSAETGLNIVAPDRSTAGHTSPGAQGPMTPQAALDAMLVGTGLRANFLPDGSAVVVSTQGTEGPLVLDEIVVDAQAGRAPGASGGGAPFDVFEEERTIETVDEEEIERANIDNVAGALDSAPNVVVTSEASPLDFQVTVRGISDIGNVNSTAPTVGVFVDGVSLNQTGATGAVINPGLVDVERVDTFLGPQTTTFSRATTAGAVNVVTNKPTDVQEFSVTGDFGAFTDGGDLFGSGSFVANMPFLEDGLLSARLVGFAQASEGFIEVFGDDVSDNIEEEIFGTRLSLRSEPIDDLTLDFQFTYTRTEFDATRLVSLDVLKEDGEFVTFNGPAGEDINDDVLVRFGASYETDIGTFSANSSYRFTDTLFDSDGDGIEAIDIFDSGVSLTSDTFSQEVRYDGTPMQFPIVPGSVTINAGASVNYVESDVSDTVAFGADINDVVIAGVVELAETDPAAFEEAAAAIGLPPDIGLISAIIGLLPPEDFGSLITDDQQDFLNVSVYGDLAWRPIPRLELSGGYRFSFDRVETSDQTVSEGPIEALGLLPASFFVVGDASFTSFSPRASISYDWTDDITTFFAFATGFRPGGITDTPSTVFEFDEEITRTFEVGLRSRFFDDRLAINAGAFYTKIEDFQTPITFLFPGTLIPPAVVLANAGDAESFGGELNVAAFPTEGLLLQAGLGINFTEITEFSAPPVDGFAPVDLSGTDLPNAPEFTLTLTGDYEYPREVLAGARPFVRADYNFRTGFIGSISETPTELDGFATLDLRFGLRSERFNLEIFGENILNEVFATSGFPGPAVDLPVPIDSLGLPTAAIGPVGTPGRPRRIGIRGKIVF